MAGKSEDAVVAVGVNDAERARNRLLGAGVVDDPYPVYDRLRALNAVHPGDINQFFENDARPQSQDEKTGFFAVSWDAVDEILRTPRIYSSSWYKPLLRDVIGYSMIEMDEPDHRRHRGLIQPAFKRLAVQKWEDHVIKPKIDALITAILQKERADLYTELCAVIPVHTIVSAFGIPAEEAEEFHELVVAVTGGAQGPQQQWDAMQTVKGRLGQIIAERRQNPRDDLLSILCEVEFKDEDGSQHKLDDDAILTFAMLMLPAGSGTTYRGLGSLLLALLNHPDQFEALKRDRTLLDAAIEEGLRWEQPLSLFGRTVTQDTVLAGVDIPAGSEMQLCIGAANNDPSRWEKPRDFNILRPKKGHVSFGTGPHTCIGIHLARMEMRAVMSAVLDKLPDIALDPSQPTPRITGLGMRMPTAVPVIVNG